jgi:RNA polymerase sigma-70 factor (ECF subfamily)
MNPQDPENETPSTRESIRENYDQIVTLHRTPLLAFLTRYLADSGAAADVAQDAFVRAYFTLDRFDDRRPFSRWLFTIAANLARDYLRKANRMQQRLQVAVHEGRLAEPSTDSGQEEEMAALEREITTLPEGMREAVVLHYQMDWPLAEVARHLDTTEGAVKTRLHRAREILREKLKPATHESI